MFLSLLLEDRRHELCVGNGSAQDDKHPDGHWRSGVPFHTTLRVASSGTSTHCDLGVLPRCCEHPQFSLDCLLRRARRAAKRPGVLEDPTSPRQLTSLNVVQD